MPLTGLADGDPPPMLLTHGFKPGVGLWPSPAIVPGQFGVTPIPWQQIQPIDLGGEVAVIPANEQAKIIPVTIIKKRKSNGEWLLSADVVNTDGGHLTYRWYDAAGLLLSEKKRFATADAMYRQAAPQDQSRGHFELQRLDRHRLVFLRLGQSPLAPTAFPGRDGRYGWRTRVADRRSQGRLTAPEPPRAPARGRIFHLVRGF